MPQRDEPKRMPEAERKAPPKAKPEPRREPRSEPAPPPRGPRVEHIADPDARPVPQDMEPSGSALPGGEQTARRMEAGFKPVDADWDDPEFEEARSQWIEALDDLAAEKPVQPHPQRMGEYLKKIGADADDALHAVQPETVAQQTRQAADRPVIPGNMRKVEVVSTDPSQVQTMHPAGEMAVGPPVTLETFLDSVPGLREFLASNAFAAAEAQAEKGKPKASPTPLFANPSVPAYTPKKYLKHYRQEVQPEKEISRRSIDQDADRPYSDDAHKGQSIKFSRGHFFATEPWQVEQLEWMRSHPQYDPVGNVLGGDPAIWVDDDDPDVLYCPGCKKPFASLSKMEAHYKATHHA